MATVQYCNYDIKGTLAVTGTSTLTGAVTITAATSSLLSIQNTTNGGGAAIRFMDTSAGSQPGDLTYKHSDSQSQGGGASWHFVAEDQTHVVVGDGSKVGRVIVKSGGTATKADYGFFDDVNTGMYRAAADTVRLAGGGVYNLGVSADNVALYYQSGLRFSTTDSGASVAGGLSIAGQNDTMLDLNQTGTDTGWSYINFKTLGTRNYYVGQDASKNFNIYNDNIDVVAISVSYASNLTTIGGDLTVSGGDITLSGTGRIQGVDTVSSGTDAANKTYVDNAVSGAGSGTFLPLAGGTMTTTAKIYFYNTSQYIHANSNNDLTIASGDDINYISNYHRYYNGGTEFARLSATTNSWIANGTNSKLGVNKSTGIDYNLDVEGTLRTTSTAIFEDKVGIGMTPVEVLDLKAASGDTRIRLDAASGSDTEVKFFNAGAAQYTVGHDDATDNFVIGGANVDAPLVSVNKAGVLIINGGNISLSGTGRIQGIDTVSASTDAANKAYVDAHVSPAGTYLPLTGGTMSGAINMGDNDIDGIDELKFSSGTKLGDVGGTNYMRLTYANSNNGGLQVVDNNGQLQGYLYGDGGATSSFGLLDGTGSWAVRCLENEYVELRYDNTTRLRTISDGVYVAGKLGIGTSDPNAYGYSYAEDLVIYGGSSADDGAGITIRGNGKRYGIIAFGDTADANAGEIFYDHDVNAMYFRTNGSNSVVFINSAGKVTAGAATGSSDGSSTLTTKGYVDAQIATIPSGLNFQGNWNASTNSPTLASGTGTPGFYYNVSVPGSTNLDGETDWQVGDWAVFVEAGATDKWEKIDNTSALTGTGVAGRVAYWDSTNNLTQDSDLTFNGSSLVVGGTVTAQTGNSVEWNSAYQDTITAFSATSGSTTVLTLTQRDGGTITTSFVNPQGTVTGGPYLPLAGGTLTGGLIGTSVDMTGGIDANQGMFNNVDGLRLINPGGGSSVGQTSTVTGAIKITLPVDFTNTMMRMTIKVFEYTTNESFTVVCGGYNYGSNQNWYNCFAHIESNANSDRNFSVRFGRNSTLNKAEIYIGELNSQWSYPQVFVTDFQAGYSSYVASSWQTGWDVNFETSAFDSVTKSITNAQVNNWARDGVNLSYTSGSGNVLVTTQAASDNSTRAASTAYVTTAVATGVGNYLPLAGGTMTGTAGVVFPDNFNLKIGTGSDLKIFHNATDSFIINEVGDLKITQGANDKDIIFESDDGSGGTTEYFRVDGSSRSIVVSAALGVYHNDGIASRFGNAGDLQIYHNATNSIISNATGNLYIKTTGADKDIVFEADDGSGGTVTEYFRLDGGSELTFFSKAIQTADNAKIFVGNAGDLQIYHDGSNSYIKDSGTGDLIINSNLLAIQNAAATETMAKFFENGSVDLYYDDSKKFETTSAGITVSGDVTADQFISTNNGNGQNYKVGDDVWLGDINVANTMRISGNQDSSKGFITFGSNNTTLGRSGTGALTWGGDFQTTGDVTVSGGDITLGGTGRIQGVDTVTDGTDAANKDYVDTAIGNINTGVTGVSSSTTSQLTVSESSPAPALSIVTAAVTNGGTALATGDQIYDATTTRLGSYLPLAGSVYDGNTASWSNGITGNLALVSTSGTKGIIIGDEDNGSGQLFVQFNSSNGGGILTNNGGNLEITAQNYGDGSDIIFKGNDTSNNIVTYFQTVGASQKVRFLDNIKLTIGNGDDLQIYHDGSNSYIDNSTGTLLIRELTNDADVIIQSDNGGGGLADYFRADGSTGSSILYNYGNQKLETTSSGVSVTGSGTFSGDVTVSGGDITVSNAITGVSGGSFRVKNNGGNTIATFADNLNATFAGDIVLSADSSIVLDDTPTASTASGSGTIVNWSVSETVVAGSLYAVKTNGGWTLADADNENTAAYMLGIALGTNATQGMLLQGFFYKSSHGFTIGAPLYISTTGGTFSNVRPTASNDYVRVIGYATSTNYIYFDPDKTWVKID